MECAKSVCTKERVYELPGAVGTAMKSAFMS